MPRRYTIGRDRSCDVPIADDSVSRLHAEMWLAEDGALMLADRGSSNGTTLLRGQETFPLRIDVVLPGDQVRFGRALLSVQDLVEAIEAKFPHGLTPSASAGGGLTPSASAGGMTPQAQNSSVAPPPPPPPPPPPSAVMPTAPNLAAVIPPPFPAGTPVRCACGAIKKQGQPCAACGR